MNNSPDSKDTPIDLAEQWRDIPGLVGFYQASNMGRIRSVPRMRRGKGLSVRPCPGIMISLFLRGEPAYLSFRASTGDSVKSLTVHRCVALAFVSNPKKETVVNHKDSNRTNNAASNLEWVTQQENCIHASKAGRLPIGASHPSKTKPWTTQRGSACHQAVLTEASVSEMRERYELGESVAVLAKEKGVSLPAAWKAVKRKSWRHVA